jgi:hypothetical protein
MSESDDRAMVDQEHSEPDTPPAHEEEMLRAVGQLLGESSGLARDYLDLLAVEGQLAGRSLVLMVALAVALGITLVAAWIFLSLAGSIWLVELDVLTGAQAMLAVTVAHVVLALLIWVVVRRLSRNLVFGGFREALQPDRVSSKNDGAEP